MTNSGNIYEFEEYKREPGGTRYYFLSEGEKQIVKAVQYAYIGLKEGRLTYNLGFGSFDSTKGTVHDDDISDNGDQYKVFNTVLSTVPDFLQNYPGAMVMVQGSDSAIGYPDMCRVTCKKKCIPPACKNANRRINIYKSYVNKNFAQLSVDYKFWGGVKEADYHNVVEEYQINNNYDSVFFIKK
ncbi:hypothetical protein D3H65_00790 [Paraflavitalea soli]|uniref:Uncharacterized protein n=1 Tax=Paraflavitalea soli TaxID=2315862 RepID=A0A3B7ME34_9BACT|nr:hypothetical protein [Paraflavitalea soli]AXY72598.1 hypothetical protein D3H65_00790 [Paraflavitalea soli]